MTVINVVTQHQSTRGTIEELFPNQKGLRQSIRTGLNCIFKLQPPLTAITQQLFKARCVLWGTDDQNFTNSRQHQSAQRVIDHGLVIDRQQLLADSQRRRVQACARTAGQNNAFACLCHCSAFVFGLALTVFPATFDLRLVARRANATAWRFGACVYPVASSKDAGLA